MATTAYVAPSESWLKVSDSLENVLISHQYVWPLYVHVGTADPTTAAGYHEVRAVAPFSMHGIAGQKVYVRSGNDSQPMTIFVTAV